LGLRLALRPLGPGGKVRVAEPSGQVVVTEAEGADDVALDARGRVMVSLARWNGTARDDVAAVPKDEASAVVTVERQDVAVVGAGPDADVRRRGYRGSFILHVDPPV